MSRGFLIAIGVVGGYLIAWGSDVWLGRWAWVSIGILAGCTYGLLIGIDEYIRNRRNRIGDGR